MNEEFRIFIETHRGEQPDPTMRVLAFRAGEQTEEFELPPSIRNLQAHMGDELFLPDLRGDLSNKKERRRLRDSALALVAPLVGLKDKASVEARVAKLRRAVAIAFVGLLILCACGWLYTKTATFQLGQMMRASREIVPLCRPETVTNWAFALSLANEVDASVLAIRSNSTGDGAYTKDALKELAVFLEALGLRESADRARAQIPARPTVKLRWISDWRIGEMEQAVAAASTGDAGGSFDTALQIEEPFYRGWALARTAQALLRHSGTDVVLSTARDPARRNVETGRRVKEEDASVDALLGAAEAFFAAGDLSHRDELAAEIRAHPSAAAGSMWATATQSRIAESFGRVGLVSEANEMANAALKTTLAMRDPDYEARRWSRLARLALVLAELGRYPDAVNVAREIRNDSVRSVAYSYVADAVARSGDIELARTTADRCSNPDDRLAGYAAAVLAVANRKIIARHALVRSFLESRQVRLMTTSDRSDD
jgi:hypothetical protein